MNLSPAMREALRRAQLAGALHRWPGGFWTDRPYTVADHEARAEVPGWHVSAHTVLALAARGLLHAPDWSVRPLDGRKLAVAYLSLTDATDRGAGATDPTIVPEDS